MLCVCEREKGGGKSCCFLFVVEALCKSCSCIFHSPLGTKIMEEASRQVESAGMNAATGLHSPEVPEPPPLVPRIIPSDVQDPLELLEIGRWCLVAVWDVALLQCRGIK